jgi:cyclophilin family peptidyl-prolyl cis-trans isomerase
VNKLVIAIFALIISVSNAVAQEPSKLMPGVYAVFETSLGNFTCELFQFQAPKTVDNFIGLAEGTKIKAKHYYDGTIFHRVIDGFMIQGGDPTGSGTGTPGYSIPDEKSPALNFGREGMLAMANTGRPNSGGSQFFITVAPRSSLNGGYTIFGHVVDGMDVVKQISKVETKPQPGSNEKSRPVKNVILKKVTIQRIKAG